MFAIILFLILPVVAFSASIKLFEPSINEYEKNKIFVSVDDENKIIESIEQGFTSEITYFFRYRKKNTFLHFPEKKADHLKKQISYKAKIDFLTGYYIIDDGTTEHLYIDKESFLSAFLSCNIPGLNKLDLSETMIEYKVLLDTITRPPPLSLLDPLIFKEKEKSNWLVYDK